MILIIHFAIRTLNVAIYYYLMPFLVSILTLTYAYRYSYAAEESKIEDDDFMKRLNDIL